MRSKVIKMNKVYLGIFYNYIKSKATLSAFMTLLWIFYFSVYLWLGLNVNPDNILRHEQILSISISILIHYYYFRNNLYQLAQTNLNIKVSNETSNLMQNLTQELGGLVVF